MKHLITALLVGLALAGSATATPEQRYLRFSQPLYSVYRIQIAPSRNDPTYHYGVRTTYADGSTYACWLKTASGTFYSAGTPAPVSYLIVCREAASQVVSPDSVTLTYFRKLGPRTLQATAFTSSDGVLGIDRSTAHTTIFKTGWVL
jgi:hypothetical protein